MEGHSENSIGSGTGVTLGVTGMKTFSGSWHHKNGSSECVWWCL